MNEEQFKNRCAEIIRENITFSGQLNDYVIHGALDAIWKLHTEQNLNKHDVSGKRPLIIELLKEFYTNNRISPEETADKILAACASGAVDKTVRDGDKLEEPKVYNAGYKPGDEQHEG